MTHDLAAWRARLTPDRPAIRFRGRWYDYAALDDRAGRLAAALKARGVGHGDRVAILAANHLAHFDLMLAAPRLGCIATPLNTRLAAAELRALVEDTEPRLLLHDAAAAETAAALGTPCIALADYEDWLAAHAPLPEPELPVVGDEDIALILFTGGSTGRPKGAMIPYRQLAANAVNTVFGWGLTEADAAVQAAPHFHAAVNVLATPLLHVGGRVLIQEAFAPGEYLDWVAGGEVTLLFMVPTMYQMLIEDPAFATTDFSAVRWAICGGAPCPAPVREAFAGRGVHFKQGYGLTEAGVNCFAMTLADAERRPDSVGRPMPWARAAVRAADGRRVPDGEVGELTLAGPHVFAGYFRRPEATAEALKDGWLWTGDLACRDAEGLYTITGRRKEMYISGGENVYPAEVEARLYDLPEVAECAVLGVPHPRWGEIGLAAVVFRPGQALALEELRARLKPLLAGYKLPRELMRLDALPKSGAGKILKPELRARYCQAMEANTCTDGS